jgi:2-desacetyl-2-hydroxyethyl bacteriochlorophyllide A dehydrogenase
VTLTMAGVVFDALGSIALRQRPVPVPGDGEVLVRIAVTGICGTDRAIVLGEFPASPGVILGHEAAGEVVALGTGVTYPAPGDRVVINPTSYCLHCRPCRRGQPAYCTEKAGREIGVDCDGTMTEYLAVHQRYVHRLPTGLTFRAAALVEPLACVLNNLQCADPRPDDQIVIIGAGPIGTLCAHVLLTQGARVSMVERDAVRARLARDILAPAPLDSGAFAEDLGGCDRPDVVIDTTGVLLEQALEVVECGGTVVVMGEREGASASLALRSLVTRGISVRGAGPYAPADFERALTLADTLDLDTLVTHVMPLDRHPEAFALLGLTMSADPAPNDPAPSDPAPNDPAPGRYQAMKVLLACDPGLAAQ